VSSLYRFTDERPAAVVEALDAALARPWPWHVLLAAPRGHLRIQCSSDITGARYWPAIGTIVMAAGGSGWMFTHELGHAVDQLTLADADRDQVREAMGVEGTGWTVNRDVQHREATGESFAEWFAYELGTTSRDTWGEHRWNTQEIRDRLRGIVMAAGNEVQVFDDVDPDSTHAEGIHWAAAEGLVSGYPDGTFGPYEPVTRGQLATVLYRQATG